MRERRRYGYIEPKKVPLRKKRNLEWQYVMFAILRLPFLALKYLFLLLSWLWRRRPHLSSKIILVGIVAVFVLFIGTFAWASRDLPDPDRLVDRNVHQSTKIYDRTGQHLLYEIFAEEKRTLVDFDNLPKHLINGVVATEDTAFYDHYGIRPLSIMRSIVYGLIGKGRVGSGASTLTQQLVKNAILTNEHRLSRKVKEVILSIRLEQVYTKNQILQIYFNEIPYGSTNYGVESAAQSYFGKSVQDVSLAEAATLAGIPKAPTTYLNDTEKLQTRRNFVLRRMYEEGYISEEEKNAAQAEPLQIKQRFENIEAPHFVLYVKEQLVKNFGEQLVETGGLKVITSLDFEKQQAAEEVVETTGTDALKKGGADNTALVAMDPNNGQILAMIGSKDFFDDEIDGQFNVATIGKRQPGSSMKPMIYAAAFEKGYTPETVVFDVITNFSVGGRPYEPLNYDLLERGPVNLRQALAGSLNIPAVKVFYLVGLDQGQKFIQKMGYSTLSDKDRFGLSLVLGGGEVIPLEHVRAYSIFANGGVRHEPVSILKVEEPDGNVLFEWKASNGERVLDQKIAAQVSSVLSDDAARAYAFGAGGILTLPGRPVAAKTGTTNNYVDGWTMGYTPDLVVGVWAGNTDNSPMTRGFGGTGVAGPIWNAFMKKALEGTPVKTFPAPPENDAEKPVLRGSQDGGITLKVDKITGKLATSSTPERYIVERTYVQPHSILHYVQKDDPRGPVPEHPEADPQYAIWEATIQDWIRRRQEQDPNWQISFEEPPTEYDDAHSLELIPTLSVVFPSPSSTLYSRDINTDIRVSAPRGVSKVTYQMDGRFIETVREHPFNLNYNLRGFVDGAHTLTIIVEDDIGNRLEEGIPFTLQAGEEIPYVSFSDVELRLDVNSFPHALFLRPFQTDRIERIRIIAEKDNTSRTLGEVTTFSELFQGQVAFTLESLDRGEWTLRTEIDVRDGERIAGGSMRLIVE